MKRRNFIIGLSSAAAALLAGKVAYTMGISGKKDQGAKTFAFTLSDEEWKKRLTPEQYHVLRDHGTERAGTSPLNKEKAAGMYHCAGCDWPLFSSENKYDSGTGWPSFWKPLNEQAVGTSSDGLLGYSRVEVHCANCGGHLGHVFDDGPPPTNKRYCMNGVALAFKAA